MKKFLLATFIFAYSLICFNANATQYIDDSSNKPNIEQIIVNVPSKVSLFPGDSVNVNIRTFDRDLYDNIEYRIEKNILYIDLLDHRYLENQDLQPDDVRINIQVPYEVKRIGTNSDMLVATVQKNKKATNDEKN